MHYCTRIVVSLEDFDPEKPIHLPITDECKNCEHVNDDKIDTKNPGK